jgi:hypothetical protein
MRNTILVAALLFIIGSVGAFAQDDLMTSTGALGADYMCTSYVAIGAVADSHYFETYDDQTTVQLMQEIKSIADATSASLQELLGNENLAIEDFNFLNEMIPPSPCFSRSPRATRITSIQERNATQPYTTTTETMPGPRSPTFWRSRNRQSNSRIPIPRYL